MTNHNVPDHVAAVIHEPTSLAPLDRKRRPVKIVEHPAFRAARARAAFDAPFTVLRLPVVSLNRAAASSAARFDASRPTLSRHASRQALASLVRIAPVS